MKCQVLFGLGRSRRRQVLIRSIQFVAKFRICNDGAIRVLGLAVIVVRARASICDTCVRKQVVVVNQFTIAEIAERKGVAEDS